MNRDPGVWIAALLTLAAWSYLFKQNLVFQVVEHVFIGISAAHAMTMAYFTIQGKGIQPLLSGDLSLLFPLIGGVLLYSRFLPKTSWLSRIPLGFTMGTAAAVVIRGSVDASFVKQIQATMLPLNSLDNVLLVLGTIATVTYFLFNLKSRGGVGGYLATFGRYVMMAAFGAAYGNTVMMRMSLLIPRVRFVFGEWLGLIK
ncbi:MAG TPA: hypothetical protein GXX32_08225 [Methanothermobacter sp.]|nr:hypothetical protein [Methanothermobacter sp.]